MTYEDEYTIAIKIKVNEFGKVIGTRKDAELMRDAMLERAFERIRNNVVYERAPLHPDKECFALLFKVRKEDV